MTTNTPDNVTIKALPTRRTDPIATTSRQPGGVAAVWIERYGFLVTAKTLPEDVLGMPWRRRSCSPRARVGSGMATPQSRSGSADITGAPHRLPGGADGNSLLIRLAINSGASVDVLLDFSRILRLDIVAPQGGQPVEAIGARFLTFPAIGDRTLLFELTSAMGQPQDVRLDLRCSWSANSRPYSSCRLNPGPQAHASTMPGRRASPSQLAHRSWRSSFLRTVQPENPRADQPRQATRSDPCKSSMQTRVAYVRGYSPFRRRFCPGRARARAVVDATGLR